MKFLILFACALAAASANEEFLAPNYGAQHLPVIGANGVPVDSPAVQQATAEHFHHKVEAQVRNGDFAPVVAPVYPYSTLINQHAAVHVHDSLSHQGAVSQHGVVNAHNYVAVHTPEHHGVVAQHGVVHGAAYASPAAYPTTAVHPSSVNGVPQETPEVAAATANHFAAHAEANARTFPAVYYRARRGVVAPFAYSGVSAYQTPVVAHSAYSAYPYAAYPAAHLYRARRGVVAPFAYSGYGHAAYAHTPVVAHSAYSAYPYAGHAGAHLYRARRGVYSPFAYSGAYAHTPVVASDSAYSTFPQTYGNFAQYY